MAPSSLNASHACASSECAALMMGDTQWTRAMREFQYLSELNTRKVKKLVLPNHDFFDKLARPQLRRAGILKG